MTSHPEHHHPFDPDADPDAELEVRPRDLCPRSRWFVAASVVVLVVWAFVAALAIAFAFHAGPTP